MVAQVRKSAPLQLADTTKQPNVNSSHNDCWEIIGCDNSNYAEGIGDIPDIGPVMGIMQKGNGHLPDIKPGIGPVHVSHGVFQSVKRGTDLAVPGRCGLDDC